MISRLELARNLFGYDPDTSPQNALNEVQHELKLAYERIDDLHARLETIDPECVYHHQAERYFRHWPIQRRTKRFVVLEPEFAGDKCKHISRQRLEAGDFVESHRIFVFVLGSTLHRHLTEMASREMSDVCGLVLSEMEILDAIDRNDELILTEEDWRTFNREWEQLGIWDQISRNSVPRQDFAKVDWKSEGF